MKNQWVYVADNVKFIIFATENKLITSMNGMLRRKIDGKFYTFPYFLTFLLKRFVTRRG